MLRWLYAWFRPQKGERSGEIPEEDFHQLLLDAFYAAKERPMPEDGDQATAEIMKTFMDSHNYLLGPKELGRAKKIAAGYAQMVMEDRWI